MRRFLPVLPLLLLAGCEAGSGPASLPIDTVRAGFPRGSVIDTIQVDAVDRLPLRVVELVAPDGSASPASSIDVVQNPTFESGQRAGEGAWRDVVSNGNAAAALTMPNAAANAALQTQTRLLAMVSSATIPLPDPVAYRRDWPQYRIRLTFGTPPGEIQTREIAAPEPPPSG